MEVNFENQPELFFIFFITMWCAVSFILSKIGGWSYLKSQYFREKDFKGQKSRFKSMKMGPVNYSNCVTIGADSTSLYLSINFLFRIGHSPLLIPLSDVIGIKEDGMVFNYVILRIKRVNIKIPIKLADKLVSFSNGNWNYSDS